MEFLEENNIIWESEFIQDLLTQQNFQKLNELDSQGDSGFTWACKYNPKLAQQIVEIDCIELNHANNIGNTGLILAAHNHPELALKLLAYDDIDVNHTNSFQHNCFIVACTQQTELTLAMLKSQHNIFYNQQNFNGQTGFMLICRNNSDLVLPFLKSQKIKKDIVDEKNLTAYDYAKLCNANSLQIYNDYLQNQALKHGQKIKSQSELNKENKALL